MTLAAEIEALHAELRAADAALRQRHLALGAALWKARGQMAEDDWPGWCAARGVTASAAKHCMSLAKTGGRATLR